MDKTKIIYVIWKPLGKKDQKNFNEVLDELVEEAADACFKNNEIRGSLRAYADINRRFFEIGFLVDVKKADISDVIVREISEVEYVDREVQEGYFDTVEDAKRNLPITDVIPFVERGSVAIETMEQAKQAAINASKYLS